MKTIAYLLLFTISWSSAFADTDFDIRSIDRSELDMRCVFTDYERIEKKFTLELSRDHKSLRVFSIETQSNHHRKVFLARLRRYTYNPTSTHISMSFENPNQRGNILYVALGVPQRISVSSGEQAQHAIIHFAEGIYLTGRCHVLFK
ncbi:MAG TPA: hypothetical protein VKY27_05670 [Bacteriovoracaceae bacterium]|jgi:hypothetical protein|nr:hypothetical protein [Bacteriovoracaceae bacterium]